MATHDSQHLNMPGAMGGVSAPPRANATDAQFATIRAEHQTSRRWCDGSARMLLQRGAGEWNCSPSVLIVMWAIPFVVAFTGIIAADATSMPIFVVGDSSFSS